MATTPKKPTTLLSPNDPTLGSTYEAGVERARRVNAQKLFEETGVEPTDPNAPTQTEAPDPYEDVKLLQEFGFISKDADPAQVQKVQNDYGGFTYAPIGGSIVDFDEAGLQRLRDQRKPKTAPSTLLGG
jgi:hypothetical protein